MGFIRIKGVSIFYEMWISNRISWGRKEGGEKGFMGLIKISIKRKYCCENF